MATDYAEMERAFVASLRDDTGRDLGQWMAAISDSGLTDRNDVIDWLRLQGFQFSWASWLERIHHNNGKLIYGDDQTPLPNTVAQAKSGSPSNINRHEDRPALGSRPAAGTQHTPPAAGSGRTGGPPRATLAVLAVHHPTPANDSVARLLSDAKGLRPLAELLLNEIRRVVPGTVFSAQPPLIVASAPQPFLALLPHPKKVRLYGKFGNSGGGIARLPDTALKAAPPFEAMIVLDDARRVEDGLRAAIAAAWQAQ
jgi:hypothetical protein